MDFILGGAGATCAGVFTNPLDVIKTRQQLQGELQSNCSNKAYSNIFTSFKSILKAEGIRGIQKGLGPALSFQFVMNSCRLGCYQTFENLNLTKFDKTQSNKSPILCMFWGGVSGIIGSAMGSPFYLVKTQIQTQSVGQYAVGYQHGHRGMVDALKTIVREQGIRGLYRGVPALTVRTLFGSGAQLTTFSLSKDYLAGYEFFAQSVFLTALASSMVSGVATVIVMNPFDVVATRLLNQGLDKNGRGLLYKNVLDCFIKTARAEGLRGLYKGVVSNYWRVAPHTILNLTFWEQFKKWKNLYVAQSRPVV